jgi:type IV pilus assembly protein PilQ
MTPAVSLDADWEGEPVSLKLVNVSLVDFFRTISELSGLNILIDPDVSGSLTINVEQIPWDQLFESVLESQGLVMGIDGNLIRISTKETLRLEEEAQSALKQAAFLAEDTVTITRHLNYSTASELLPSFKNQLSPRGQIDVDERTNTLIITDVAGSVDKLISLADKLDVAERQVEIEARIIEATTTFSRQLGVELGLRIGRPTDRNLGVGIVSAPADPENTFGLAGFVTGKSIDVFQLDALITAGEQNGEARILSKPRVSAQNNAEARITQGAKIPIPVQMNFTTTVQYETAALQLTVTPKITEENTIYMDIKVENSVPDFSQTVLGIPTILTSESETQVLVPDGGTTVIGGIFVEIDRAAQDKVPGLGDVPVLGHLFKKDSKERETREILFFITPRISQ